MFFSSTILLLVTTISHFVTVYIDSSIARLVLNTLTTIYFLIA